MGKKKSFFISSNLFFFFFIDVLLHGSNAVSPLSSSVATNQP